ncbi:hypothetical protein F4818DRAFT_446291 [Hypoxylon cercidicola]|nr:hypothetical protein F4818DRAFT_446291 [Hypoxylon cercidicola]
MRIHLDSMEGSSSSDSVEKGNDAPDNRENDHLLSQSQYDNLPNPATEHYEFIPPVPIPLEVLAMPFDVVLETFPWLPRLLQNHFYDYNPRYLYHEHPDVYPGRGRYAHTLTYAPSFDLPHDGSDSRLFISDPRDEAFERGERYRATANQNGVPPILMNFNDIDYNRRARAPVDEPVSPRTVAGHYDQPVEDGRDGYNQPEDGRDGYNQPTEAGWGGYNQPAEDGRGGYNQPEDGRGGYNQPEDGRDGYNQPTEAGRGGYNQPEDGRGGYNQPMETSRGSSSQGQKRHSDSEAGREQGKKVKVEHEADGEDDNKPTEAGRGGYNQPEEGSSLSFRTTIWERWTWHF